MELFYNLRVSLPHYKYSRLFSMLHKKNIECTYTTLQVEETTNRITGVDRMLHLHSEEDATVVRKIYTQLLLEE